MLAIMLAALKLQNIIHMLCNY